MTLGQNDLTRPLGLETNARKPRRLGLAASQVFVLAVAGLFLLLAGWLALNRDPFAGEPFAVARVERRATPAPAPAAPAQPERSGSPDRTTAAELEARSGVSVVRGGGEAPQGVVIHVPAEVKLAPAPDPRLVERVGPYALPRVGADGARPVEVYARPAPPASGKLAGRIAVVVNGLGVSASLTADALARLPGEVTLGFSPYGAEIDRQVARARAEGHEVLLQTPMEPFDYPASDPGPHTLTVAGAPDETLERLRWVMARFPGYIGLSNAMGAKFTASEAALAPVLREIGARGLAFLDDGSSPRSLVSTLAPAAKAPAARADLTLDAPAQASAIDAQLARLEAIARDKGTAIAVASPLPLSVERIALWAQTLEAKGLQLVPVSAVILKPGRT
ncbi:divergent polysaccharide deacetylase family protein [Alsobacter sp. SYSU M60028]|uniref:Divergent polysaccharide deacetylase family protein n=1 Tax=Alsobacter ponti TaxID=2962936 RepID=A0ABT1LHU8_9HYPH|nr:divergent polysaccharide deacetylase family protein [Alsobacter ponti]